MNVYCFSKVFPALILGTFCFTLCANAADEMERMYPQFFEYGLQETIEFETVHQDAVRRWCDSGRLPPAVLIKNNIDRNTILFATLLHELYQNPSEKQSPPEDFSVTPLVWALTKKETSVGTVIAESYVCLIQNTKTERAWLASAYRVPRPFETEDVHFGFTRYWTGLLGVVPGRHPNPFYPVDIRADINEQLIKYLELADFGPNAFTYLRGEQCFLVQMRTPDGKNSHLQYPYISRSEMEERRGISQTTIYYGPLPTSAQPPAARPVPQPTDSNNFIQGDI